ncbi:histidine phosphatase family protein [Clostridium algidicarnis]|uniref:histidine phosphatase family protein n=1 Tax=Clostridium algidicarnis TaxID=37659 RepID=UPI001C0B7C22|nr:histidine phosphatase family protein [Clostridium algidicarnis]MBU3197466.1 histidine phosphatase family protein [Clostridium algidicarnis]MBU3210487.1 histidine phosphatase family protein [Clostridium algidicarnis]MBU3228151.1 histidine phosphatase family protein [Clostridium algidicarnis]MBU3252035.1 histidine phosphatase family protein [Clostridium algidicarnis]
MNIYIARHGETKWNIEGRMQGFKNSDLTQRGVSDARSLGESLKDIDFDCIHSSPLGRALDTAKYIRQDDNIKIILDDSLKELNLGLWEGMTHEEIKEKYPLQYNNFREHPESFESQGGESFLELIKRVEKGLNNIIKDENYENILIVTHTCVIKAISIIVKGNDVKDFWNLPFINNTSLTILEVINKEIKVLLEADVSHLKQ